MRRQRVLIFTNFVTLVLLLYVGYKSRYFQQTYNRLVLNKTEIVDIYSFSLNPKYIEQINYCAVYTKQSDIAMLGNSHVYRINWDDLLNRTDVANRGVGSDITAGFISRLPFVYAVKPKICFIEGGINDIFRGFDDSTILNNFSTIITELKTRNISPVLMSVCKVTKRYSNAKEVNDRVEKLNTGIKALALKDHVRLLDLNAYLEKDGYLSDEFAGLDGLHFSGTAYLIWKEEIQKVLLEVGL
ncbi:MAG: GDSL-type esterase/lipase family protein [Bacteroidota bacterium]